MPTTAGTTAAAASPLASSAEGGSPPASAAPAAAPPAGADASAPSKEEAAPEPPKDDPEALEALDIRVGKILSCEQHPDADSLYVETIDVGEAEPRTIVSGLVKYVPLEQMQNRMVLVLANLKPRNMRGIKSAGMLLCASNDAHDVVEPLVPPPEAKPGDRAFFGDKAEQAPPAPPNQVGKKKIWEGVQPGLRTDGQCVATYFGRPMKVAGAPVKAATLTNGSIS